ncbi:hypothetical protein [Streptomyces yaizuensis]|uniref:Uncharacterized protein n=1 Tax=Streptomyces yaizuensis TaxID=2989713 RepID=A0ABQ5NVY6_9ACTN|nr:hypothetical protein [Streptomyces sp. YSPA8]GLF94530.1 hypothetical protein SYYSPA8_09555 [Streptomyces sp. YSPA8]
MISNIISFDQSVKMTDRPVVASACSLGFSVSLGLAASFRATGVSGAMTEAALRPLGGLPVLERIERPTKALEAVVAAAQVPTYAFAATGAGFTQHDQNHKTWAFRGLEPWSDPA